MEEPSIFDAVGANPEHASNSGAQSYDQRHAEPVDQVRGAMDDLPRHTQQNINDLCTEARP